MALQFLDDNSIEQTERLFSVRPRSTSFNNQGDISQTVGGGNRGSRARFRILTTDLNKSRNRDTAGFSSRSAADYLVSRLVTDTPGFGFQDFLLTSVSIGYNEKVQITQTYGDAEVVYYFGKAPIIVNLGGLLIDDIDNQWFTNFIEAYTHMLRGTELARNYEVIELTLPNMVIIGTVMSLGYTQDSSRDTDIPFTMTVHAKELRPLPVQLPNTPLSPEAQLINFGKVVDFTSQTDINVLKDKIKSEVQLPGILGGTSKVGAVLPTFGGAGDTVGNFGTTINAFRASLFSPIYGVLTSITKVVKSVTGDISKIISSFTNPVNTILRDIKGVAAQAVSVVKLVENSINQIVNIPLRTLTELRDTITALKNTAGVIARAPETIASSIRRLFHVGILNGGAAFLTANGKNPNGKLSLLNSGRAYTPQAGASLRL